MDLHNTHYHKKFLMIVSCLLLNGCVSSDARNPYVNYTLVRNSPSHISSNDKEALKNAATIHLLPGKIVKTAIIAEDPRIVANGFYSNYKVFEIHGEMNTRYNIELRSLCDCFGMDKLMLYPIARVVDARGKTINDNPTNIVMHDSDMKYPVNLRMNWEGTFNSNGKYYLLVSAYNENIGSSYLTFKEFDFLATQIQKLSLVNAYLQLLQSAGNREGEIKDPSVYPLWTFPTGNIVVTLRIYK